MRNLWNQFRCLFIGHHWPAWTAAQVVWTSSHTYHRKWGRKCLRCKKHQEGEW